MQWYLMVHQKNVVMAEKRGCNIKNFDGSFPHSCHFGKKVHAVFDVCHMIKLARNAFSDMKIFPFLVTREFLGNIF